MQPILLFRKKIYVTLAAVLLFFIAIMLYSYSGGPAKTAKTTVTGATFNNKQTCTNCHSGGNFGAGITLQLLDSKSNVVSSYVPGQLYSFKISMTHTKGTPKYGFQTTASLTSNQANVNTWGTPPANTHNTLVAARNYVEQSTALTTAAITIPWTGPAKGSGSVIFNTAGNEVNGDGGMSGDQPVSTSLTVSESLILPVTILYFNGIVKNNTAQLSWATATEINSKTFNVEKSPDGKNYNSIATIPAKGNINGSTYSYTDISFNNDAFYRLKETDADGSSSYTNVLNLKVANSKNYDISMYAHAGYNYVLFYNGYQQQKASVAYYTLDGKMLYHGTTDVNVGNNMWQLPSTMRDGIVIVTVITEDGIRTSRKVAVIK